MKSHSSILAHPLVASILAAWPGAEVLINGEPPMENLTAQEIEALEAASFAGGDFLENNVGQTDLARLTHDQWMQFVETLVGTYVDKMAESHAPFAVSRSEDDPCRPITEDELTH